MTKVLVVRPGKLAAFLPVKDRLRQSGSALPESECCAVAGDGGCEAYTVIGWGVGLSHEKLKFAEAEPVISGEGNMCGTGNARRRRSAGVEGHITSERNAPEPERSHVRPKAARAIGPHREGEEPKPMMHGHEKSDSAVVAMKSPNKTGQPAAEAVERRAETKENANQYNTCRTQRRESVQQILERVRKAEKDVRFAAKHPRWEPDAGKLHVRICAGGAQ